MVHVHLYRGSMSHSNWGHERLFGISMETASLDKLLGYLLATTHLSVSFGMNTHLDFVCRLPGIGLSEVGVAHKNFHTHFMNHLNRNLYPPLAGMHL